MAFVDLQRIRITIQSPNTTLYHGMDESYNLTSSSTNNDIEVHAATAVVVCTPRNPQATAPICVFENNHHLNNSPVYQVAEFKNQDAPRVQLPRFDVGIHRGTF